MKSILLAILISFSLTGCIPQPEYINFKITYQNDQVEDVMFYCKKDQIHLKNGCLILGAESVKCGIRDFKFSLIK